MSRIKEFFKRFMSTETEEVRETSLEERLQIAVDDSNNAMSVFYEIKQDLEVANLEIVTLVKEVELEVDQAREEYEAKMARFNKLEEGLTNTHTINESRIRNIKVALGETSLDQEG